jgi:hypothetical protein
MKAQLKANYEQGIALAKESGVEKGVEKLYLSYYLLLFSVI